MRRRRTAKEKPIFKDLLIATAGDLGGQWTDVNIARWVGLREGRLSTERRRLEDGVTHLVCSAEEFRNRNGGGGGLGLFLLFFSFFHLLLLPPFWAFFFLGYVFYKVLYGMVCLLLEVWFISRVSE
jgi:hypothetical protein